MRTGFIFDRKRKVQLSYFRGESNAVILAINNLKNDIYQVFGCNAIVVEYPEPKINNNYRNADDVSEILISSKDVFTCINGMSALSKWEGFAIKQDSGRLYICGADKRGTIFGIYEISKYIGVSPWYYFADIPIKKKDHLLIPNNYIVSDYPSVQYRGIFLNDEEELENWAKKHTPDRTIGPYIYKKIFELLLRLKGNYIWPAMHVNYFQENPENARLANDMGIVVGTSHCDMLMRSNQNEWNPWLKSKGYDSTYKAVHSNKIDKSGNVLKNQTIYYDYSIPGHNREVINEYWRESVDMNKDYEVCYTVGMRGVHDYGFETSQIDNNETFSETEKEKQRIRLLEEIIETQRKFIGKKCLQSFIPYKEVLDLYNKGLHIPDDVTLIWVDDNFGYMRRYPDKNELKRSGGHGMYYHVSYWAAPDMNYLFFNSIPLAQVFNELKKAYQSGIQKMWVLNVGALKPLEMEIEAFIDYGWNAEKENTVINDVHTYTANWFNRIFSGDYGEKLAILYERFSQLINIRKIEHMTSQVFSQSGYGDEAGERVCELEDIYISANDIYNRLPKSEKEAFYQLFLFKVNASYYFNCSYYYADRSIIMFDRKNNRAADYYTWCSDKMMYYLRKDLKYYNKIMCGGKWDGILTPDSFPPPGINFYPVCKQSIKRNESGMSVTLWDGSNIKEEGKIELCSRGVTRKWIEIGNLGTEQFSFSIDCNSDWVVVSEKTGVVDTEKRIYISAVNIKNNIGNEAELVIKNINSKQVICMTVVVVDHKSNADGAICIHPDQYVSNVKNEFGDGWEVEKMLGRGYGNAVTAYKTFDSDNKPYLEYAFYLSDPGSYELFIIRYLTLNAQGKIKLGISVDDKDVIEVLTDTIDEWKGKWKESVLNNGEKISIDLPYLASGEHILRLYMIDKYVTITKMVIYTKNRRENLLEYSDVHYLRDFPIIDWDLIDDLQDKLYVNENDKLNEIIIPDVVYANREFWNYTRIYMKNDSVKQAKQGNKRYNEFYFFQKGMNLTDLFGDGIFIESNGIIALETEYTLENSEYAFLSSDCKGVEWEPVHAPSDGGTGLAMISPGCEVTWNDPSDAPGMHFKVMVENEGEYKLWLNCFYENHMSDTCYISIDGKVQPLEKQFCKGRMFNYSTAHLYYWCLLCNVTLPVGDHTISIYAGDSGLRIDRIYLTKGKEIPPTDDCWKVSERNS